jgi:hypothetical protein
VKTKKKPFKCAGVPCCEQKDLDGQRETVAGAGVGRVAISLRKSASWDGGGPMVDFKDDGDSR